MPRYLGHIFQGLLGQLAVLDLVTVFAGQRHEGVSLPQLLLLFFPKVGSKGEFDLARTRADSSVCVCLYQNTLTSPPISSISLFKVWVPPTPP